MTSHRWALIFWGAMLLGAGVRAQSYRPLGTAPQGSVPGGVHYQGRLEDNGYPATGTRNMTFRLYDAPAGGNLLWNSGALPVDISQGIFGVDLAISTPALAGANLKYLEVTIDATTLTPRETLGAVPYAMVAKAVEGTLDLVGGGLSVSSTTTSQSASLFVSSTSGFVGIMDKTPATLLHMSSGTLTIDGNVATSIVAKGAVSVGTVNAPRAGVALDVPGGTVQAATVKGDNDLILTSANGASVVSLRINGAERAKVDTDGTLRLTDGYPLLLSGSGGTITSASSVTASAFFGNGLSLTNVSGANLTADSVDTSKLKADSVIAAKILAGSVQTAKLAADAVTNAALLTDANSLAKVSGGLLTNSANKLVVGGGSNQVSAWLSATLAGWSPGALAVNACATNAVAVAGAADGNECYVGVPVANAGINGLLNYCYVSAVNTVTIKACCVLAGGCGVTTPQNYRVTTFLH